VALVVVVFCLVFSCVRQSPTLRASAITNDRDLLPDPYNPFLVAGFCQTYSKTLNGKLQ
jgi:hypothetical protein